MAATYHDGWETRTGRELRSFPMATSTVTEQPHMFKWSFDDKYVARMGKDKAGGDDDYEYEYDYEYDEAPAQPKTPKA